VYSASSACQWSRFLTTRAFAGPARTGAIREAWHDARCAFLASDVPFEPGREDRNPMQKLKLDLEMLKVETFGTAAGADERGTVMAHSGWTQCGNLTCLLSLCDCAAA
jgi:hypothetical protein